MLSWKNPIQLFFMLLLIVSSASTTVSAKLASGVQNVNAISHQGKPHFNPLTHLAKIDFRSTSVSGSPVGAKSASAAAKRLGVNLDKIPINNGIARTQINISSRINPKDINQLKDVLRSRGATRAEIDTGFIANSKLDTFLRRRVQDGKPFNGGTVRFSNSKKSDFTIDFNLK